MPPEYLAALSLAHPHYLNSVFLCRHLSRVPSLFMCPRLISSARAIPLAPMFPWAAGSLVRRVSNSRAFGRIHAFNDNALRVGRPFHLSSGLDFRPCARKMISYGPRHSSSLDWVQAAEISALSSEVRSAAALNPPSVLECLLDHGYDPLNFVPLKRIRHHEPNRLQPSSSLPPHFIPLSRSRRSIVDFRFRSQQ